MSRLASIGARIVHQPVTLAIYTQLQASTDWDYVPGAALAALTGGNTLNVTSRHHKVTIVGGTIDNIADAAGASEGQLLELYCTGATTIRNNGGGAGNIRSISGQDIAVAANDVIELVFDGTNWRECARANLNLPSAGKIVWGASGSGDTQTGRLAAGVLGDTTTALSTGPASAGLTGSQTVGVVITNGGAAIGFQASSGIVFASALTTDSGGNYRFQITANGVMSWAPGSGGSSDTTAQRSDVGVLKIANVKRAAKGTLAYSASITPDPRTAEVQTITVTNTTAFTINAPSPAPAAGDTQDLTIEIVNSSGGTMGTITWNAAYAPLAAGQPINYGNPANGKKRAVFFRWNGAVWVNLGVAQGDY